MTLWDELFVITWDQKQAEVHQIALEKGWYEEEKKNLGELIALAHSELSEALEALRHGNPLAEHIQGFSAAEEELADVVIRLMDLAQSQGWRLGEAISAKIAYNRTRPHRHGEKLF